MSRPTREPSADGGLVHALLYRRVSGAEHQKAGLSMGAQEVATRRYVAGKDGWAISGEYSDVMSGRKPQRPGYQAMLEHARQLHRDGVAPVRRTVFVASVRQLLSGDDSPP